MRSTPPGVPGPERASVQYPAQHERAAAAWPEASPHQATHESRVCRPLSVLVLLHNTKRPCSTKRSPGVLASGEAVER